MRRQISTWIQTSPLANRSFALVWSSELISLFGSSFQYIAIQVIILKLTGSGLALSFAILAGAIPRALLMLAGGGWADRYGPHRILLLANLSRGVLILSLSVFLWTGGTSYLLVILIIALVGVGDGAFYPAMLSTVPCLLPEDKRAQGNAFLQMSMQSAGIAGPVLAGFVIAATGPAIALGIDGISFLVAFAILLACRFPQRQNIQSKSSMWEEAKRSLNYALSKKMIRSLIIVVASVNFFFLGPYVIGTALVAERDFSGSSSLGIMLASFATGALFGSVLMARRGMMKVAVRCIRFVPLSIAFTLLAMAILEGFGQAVVSRFLAGLVIGFANVAVITLLQNHASPNRVGRVMGAVGLASIGLQPITFAFAGALSEIGIRQMFLVAALMMSLSGIFSLLSEELKPNKLSATFDEADTERLQP
jgi:MFS family permease